jgi:teichuronic acid biosynthesis glycosyltransferase TuaC
MHVLVIPSSYPTRDNPVRGCFYREQARAIGQYGLRVGVVAPVFRSLRHLCRADFRGPAGLRVENDQGVHTVLREQWARFSLFPRLHGQDWLKAGHDLFHLYVDRFGRPDVIHAHGALPAGRLASAIGVRTGIPYVLTEHSTAFSCNKILPWQESIVRQVLAQAAARVMVSPELGHLLEMRYGSDARPWQWIPNSVAPIFRPADRQCHSAAGKRFRFLNVALLTSKKGHDILLRATADLLAGNIDAELRIVGGGPLRRSLVRLSEQLGIASHVTFLGTVDRDRVMSEMQSADCFVLSSRCETFGVVLIEALACGLPVIATTCGGPECIVEKPDGLLIPPNDVPALAHAMRQVRLTANDYQPTTLRRRCLARFGEQTVARQIVEIYARVVRTAQTDPKAQVA